MRPVSTSALATLLVLFAFAPAAAGKPELAPAKIRKILADRVDVRGHAPGIVVGIVNADGTRVIAHGTLSATDPTPVNGDTIFEIGSVTKLFTSLALADMVERGEVGLEDPLSRYVPSNVAAPFKNETPIRLLDLARHEAGLPREPGNYAEAEEYAPDSTYTVDEMFGFVNGLELESEPGAKFEYSNLGFGLLGEVLARKTGLDYDSLIRTRICEPLGMTSTSIDAVATERFATGHLLDRSPVKSYRLDGLQGAGGLKSSVNDLLRFVAANLGMLDTRLDPAIKRTQLGRRDFGFPDETRRLAWYVGYTRRSETLSHGGKMWGTRAFVALSRGDRLGIVVLSNSQHEISDIGWHLMDRKNALNPQD